MSEKIVLFNTSHKFPIGTQKFPVFEDKEKSLYIQIVNYYPNGDVANEHIRPIIWSNRPYKSNECSGKFQHDAIRLGESNKDFILAGITRNLYEEIQEDPALAIAQLVSQVAPMEKMVENLKFEQKQNDRRWKDCSKKLKLTQHHLRNTVDVIKVLHGYLKDVFSMKKWRKKLSKDFFQEIDEEKRIFTKDDLPF